MAPDLLPISQTTMDIPGSTGATLEQDPGGGGGATPENMDTCCEKSGNWVATHKVCDTIRLVRNKTLLKQGG